MFLAGFAHSNLPHTLSLPTGSITMAISEMEVPLLTLPLMTPLLELLESNIESQIFFFMPLMRMDDVESRDGRR